MSKLAFTSQWNAVKAWLESASAAELAALSPRPAVKRGQPEQWEDLIDPWLVIIDLLGSDQDRSRATASNTHQTWGTGFRVYCAARGATMDLADEACLSVVSAICNDFSGSGSYAGTDRSTLFTAIVDRWSWDPGNDNDMLSMAFVDITATFYRH